MSFPQNNISQTQHKDHDHHHHFKTYTATEQLHQIYAAAISGCLTRTLTNPLDVLKIRFQLQVESNASVQKYTTMRQAFRLIYKEEGMRAFFKGHNAGQLMSIAYSVVQFWTYEQAKLAMTQVPMLNDHKFAYRFLSGALSGCVATIFSLPFDVIRTRLVAQDAGAGYRNLTRAFPEILRVEGVSGLYRGLGTTLVQIGPMVGCNFMLYDLFNDVVCKSLNASTHMELPFWCFLITGGAAGATSKAIVYPLDFIKKRLQMRGFESHRQTFGRNQHCRGIFHCVMLTAREEGIKGFYKGLTPTLYKSGFTTAFYYSIYHEFKWLFS